VLIRYSGNSRLYDTEAQRYTTVEKIRHRVLGGEPVLDHKTGEYKTTNVLLSIIKAENPTAEELRSLINQLRERRKTKHRNGVKYESHTGKHNQTR